MRYARFILPLAAIFLFSASFYASAQSRSSVRETADKLDEENARVARISLIRGDVQIKRAGENEWENAVVNLPIVEGDLIAADRGARVEVQIGKDNFFRLADSSILEVVTLRDKGGVALSLPEGTLSLTIGEFDAERDFIEIDAPKTTVSIEKKGAYRIDTERDAESLFVAAFDGGEARVYSDGTGFSLRTGKRAELFVRGSKTGEFRSETFTADDEWNRWTRDRDIYLAERRDRDSQYYDREIYGADELSDYGEWINTRDYGYVWRPHKNQRGRYDNWSPYRYGTWRYIAPFGWVWVSDEPWGYATSYYGRWVFVSNDWCWTPYFGVRPRWYPSQVVFSNVGRHVYWYPMPYDYHYTYVDRRRIIVHNTTIINVPVVVNPTPTPAPPDNTPNYPSDDQGIRPRVPPLMGVSNSYQTAVTGVPVEEFGKTRRNIKSAPPEEAKEAVKSKTFLPEERYSKGFYNENKEVKIRPAEEIVVKNSVPAVANGEIKVKTGVENRDAGVKIGDRLRRKVFMDERRSAENMEDQRVKNAVPAEESPTKTRDTGVFERRREKRAPLEIEQPNEKSKDSRKDSRNNSENDSKRRSKNKESDVFAPVRQPPLDDSRKPRRERGDAEERPTKRDNSRDETPRYEPPTRRQEPRFEPTPRDNSPKREEPRAEPPTKRESSPKSEEPSRKPDPETKDGRRQ